VVELYDRCQGCVRMCAVTTHGTNERDSHRITDALAVCVCVYVFMGDSCQKWPAAWHGCMATAPTPRLHHSELCPC
jgi:hypothetical protein